MWGLLASARYCRGAQNRRAGVARPSELTAQFKHVTDRPNLLSGTPGPALLWLPLVSATRPQELSTWGNVNSGPQADTREERMCGREKQPGTDQKVRPRNKNSYWLRLLILYGLKPVSLNVLLFFKKAFTQNKSHRSIYTVIKRYSMYFIEKSKLQIVLVV